MAESASHRDWVGAAPAGSDEPTAVYEVRLQGMLEASLRRRFPTATVVTTRTETVLYRQIERPEELDALIAELLSLGLVLTEVQPCMEPDGSAGAHTRGRSAR